MNRETIMQKRTLTKKSNYSMHPGFERMGSLASKEAQEYDPEALVDAMFVGSKAALWPLFEQLLKIGLALGHDVKACPCKTIVPLYRRHVFAQIKPATNTRLDLGFALKNTKTPERLIDTGGRSKGDRITHRIPIESAKDIDDEVKHWLKIAYEFAAAEPRRLCCAAAATRPFNQSPERNGGDRPAGDGRGEFSSLGCMAKDFGGRPAVAHL
ncbi:MAG: hypothetical protein EXS37_12160 [Opitutus sp.]|nr:hypothetical protein [Opitutus sp.]